VADADVRLVDADVGVGAGARGLVEVSASQTTFEREPTAPFATSSRPRAGVLCAPSLGGESFGIVLIEGMVGARRCRRML